MVVAILNVVVGLALAFAAAQEGVVGGLMAGRPASLLVGIAGTVTSLLLVASGVASLYGGAHRRGFTLTSCLLVAAFSTIASLPPHRYLGVLAMLLGIVYPLGASWYVARRAGSGPGSAVTPRPA
jgi:hypothetical protein